MDNLLGSDDNGLFVVCVFVLVGGHSVGARGKALRRELGRDALLGSFAFIGVIYCTFDLEGQLGH